MMKPEKTVYDDDINENLEETTRSSVVRPLLILLDGSNMNRRFRINKHQMTLGRDLKCDISLSDSRCSRHHARLIYKNFERPQDDPEVEIVDLNSTNGVFVNGMRAERHLLCDRDKILLGSLQFGFFLRDEHEIEADQRLYDLANIDPLTGLRNRGVFNAELNREFDRARRYGRHLALVMFDIDHFKRVNDTYGHQTGDYVLQELGRLTKANVRGHDIAARYGGEEFAIILPETSLEGAFNQAARLQNALSANPFHHEEHTFNLTISLGVAALEASLTSPDDLVKVTDRALYQAKADGRNCVCTWARGKVQSDNATC